MTVCMDCGYDVEAGGEYCHPLKDKVWLKINPQDDGVLCFKCMEKRLGRCLSKADFYFPESFLKLRMKGIL